MSRTGGIQLKIWESPPSGSLGGFTVVAGDASLARYILIRLRRIPKPRNESSPRIAFTMAEVPTSDAVILLPHPARPSRRLQFWILKVPTASFVKSPIS